MGKVETGKKEADTIDEVFSLMMTEWEHDTLIKALSACQYPGTHVDLISKFMKKIKNLEKEIYKDLKVEEK
jgi:hypothetical protein